MTPDVNWVALPDVRVAAPDDIVVEGSVQRGKRRDASVAYVS